MAGAHGEGPRLRPPAESICCAGPHTEEEKHSQIAFRRQERFPLQRWTSVNLEEGAEERRLRFPSPNHLRVDPVCDTLQPRWWWMSRGTKEVADVSVIITSPPGTLAAIAQARKKERKQQRFLSKGTAGVSF